MATPKKKNNKKTSEPTEDLAPVGEPLPEMAGDIPPCVCDNQCLSGLNQKDIDKALENAPIVDKPAATDEGTKEVKEFLKKGSHTDKSGKDAQPKPKNGDEQFGLDCYNLDIDARKCFAESERHHDETVVEYIRGINRKILDEVRAGGYSTNITFRVLPNDWVNVTHITDWYRARGFQVLNYVASSPSYMNEGSTLTHTFTISWAVVD